MPPVHPLGRESDRRPPARTLTLRPGFPLPGPALSRPEEGPGGPGGRGGGGGVFFWVFRVTRPGCKLDLDDDGG